MNKPKKVVIHCLVAGLDSNDAFSVVIKDDMPLTALRQKVHDQGGGLFSNVDVWKMRLFKLKVPLELGDPGLAAAFQPDASEPLVNMRLVISQVFENPTNSKVYVVVTAPHDPRKRARSESVSVKNELASTQLVKDAPSRVGKPSEYWELQANPNARILDDRPSPDPWVAPIALLYHGFGSFDDIITGRTLFETVARDSCIILPEFDAAVNSFVTDMAQQYHRESDRRDRGLENLNRLLAAGHGPGYYELSPSAIGLYTADGRSVCADGSPLTVAKFKNQTTDINADACVEGVAYVAQLTSRLHETPTWRLPCIVITIVGCAITFYAMCACNGRDVEVLRLAFAATIHFRKTLLADILRYSSHPPRPIPAGSHRFPSVSRLRQRGAEGTYLNFELQHYALGEWQPRRLVYNARTFNEEGQLDAYIIVKFTRGYCVELHEFCSKAGFAPKLLAYEALPGGWYGIAMEYLEDTRPLDNRRFATALRKLVSDFHAEGWVHGDLRDANIRYRNDQFWLIDYDWGGKDGEAEYPTRSLNEELLTGRATSDLKIRKGDDDRVLGHTLDKCT